MKAFVSKPALDISYTHQRTAVEIQANIAAGWSRGAKTYEYHEHAALGFTGDYTIKLEISLVPFPRGFHNAAHRFPTDQQCYGGDENIHYQLHGSLLITTIQLLDREGRLNPALDWSIADNGRVLLHWFASSIAEHGSTSFELQLKLAFYPPAHATNEDLRQWFRRHLPAISPQAVHD